MSWPASLCSGGGRAWMDRRRTRYPLHDENARILSLMNITPPDLPGNQQAMALFISLPNQYQPPSHPSYPRRPAFVLRSRCKQHQQQPRPAHQTTPPRQRKHPSAVVLAMRLSLPSRRIRLCCRSSRRLSTRPPSSPLVSSATRPSRGRGCRSAGEDSGGEEEMVAWAGLGDGAVGWGG